MLTEHQKILAIRALVLDKGISNQEFQISLPVINVLMDTLPDVVAIGLGKVPQNVDEQFEGIGDDQHE